MSSNTLKSAAADAHLDAVFQALGDRTRRALLARLSEGSAKISDLARPFEISLQAIGKHLRVLEKAGLVERTVTGRVHRCSLNALPLQHADQWLEHYQAFWTENLDMLALYLENTPDQDEVTR